MAILLKSGRVITADSDSICDILVQDEAIAAIGRNLPMPENVQVIDCAGKLIVPGGIDPHVHLSMPFMGTFSSDTYETGTRAALHGGTTTVIDFILQKQGNSLRAAFEEWSGRASGTAVGDYSFHMAVTDFNPNTQLEIEDMVNEGITSFKTFMAYKGALMIDDAQMVGLMQEVKKHGGLVTAHATNGDMIDTLIAQHRAQGKLSPLYHYLSQPEVTEAEASGRFADIANYTGVNAYIVHLTCQGALNQVRRATERNQRVLVETCIQYLVLDASLYENEAEGAKWVMSPPLREKKDQATLWAGINQGLVNVVGTDHCPFMWEQKLLGKDDFSKIPNGHPAVEHRMELLFSEGVSKGRITPQKFVEVTSTNAGKIFGLFPRKGTISIGADADLVVIDPEKQHTISAATHHMNVDYSGYEGWELTGKIETVLLRGQVAIEAGEARVGPGYGQFIKRGKTAF
ncbi:dihydropyrimidinase [Hymenobacter ginsengisoli]|uniref:Dihydropyrimidinase n=1 Tax=Hymenobacter ginsengisoli TaxID=1051626 RepID=A0ABP8QP64_9BACT|nr:MULTISPECIES: dihydropyrimidinase [unclassified Hymenobacter]MBO2032973.1 dihydropyrimidinase [Hymenobacter sp. BT559]